MREFEEKRVPWPVKRTLSLAAGLFLAVGLLVGLFFQQVTVGVLLFSLGAVREVPVEIRAALEEEHAPNYPHLE